MAVVHIPRIRGNFGGVVIPRAIFDGANPGLGVFCADGHTDPAAVERDLRRAAKAQDAVFAGRLSLPAGVLFGVEMPADPAKLFIQLGESPSEVRSEVNAVNLRDPSETDVMSRWRGFQQMNQRALATATDEERAAFSMSTTEVGTNGRGALVLETPFGRAFTADKVHHAEWQLAADGQRKGQGGRASLFLRAYDMQDWAFLARGLVAQLHRFPDQRIGTRELERLMDVARTPKGPQIGMDQLRELIEGEVALVRAQGAVEGREFAEAVSVGFPPHDPADRLGRRVVYAQFSTPPSVGEVAAEYLKPNGRTVLEPTIGNGVLAAATYAAGGLMHGIEIDEPRHGRVAEAMPEARIVLGDAMDPGSYPSSRLRPDGKFDAVLANPPYAKPDERPEKVLLGDFGIELPASTVEGHIAARAIDRLHEGGNAVLVMPAQMMRPDQPTVEARRFQTMLHSVFRKVESVGLDASLYRSMGANFPVVVHFCEDRRPNGKALHVAEAARAVPDRIDVVGTFAAFYERADRIIRESRIAALPTAEANARRAAFFGTDEPEEEPAPAPTAGPEVAGGGSDQGDGRGNSGRGEGRGSVRRERPSRAERPEPGQPASPASPAEPEGGSPEAPSPAGAELDAPKRSQPREWFVDDFSPDPFTVPYTPRSRKGSTLAVIERTMADETYAALRRVEEAVNMTVDEYVAGKMGVSIEAFLGDRVLFYPEQVDSLALSFHRREQGRATILGDQMGVGKGIQLAAHAYSSIAVQERSVLMMTNRANLFSDLCVRDWRNASGQRFTDMVAEGTVRPFIFNSGADGALRDNEKIVFATPADMRREAQRTGTIADANLVMMTYSQVQTTGGAWRHQAIKAWLSSEQQEGRTPVLLLDEAHKAAGEDSRTGVVIQDLLAHAGRLGAEVIYSSATSLKSGRNLPVYTPALPNTGLSTPELLLAIERMPLAMQEILAAEMARDGALIERKMSDAGLSRDLVVLADIDPEKMDRTRAMTDRVSAMVRELADMGPVIAERAKMQFISGLGGRIAAGSVDKVRVETTSVASQLDSFSRYLMGAVKGQFVAELLEDAVARGSKPAVVLEYTGDSVSRFVIGDRMGEMSLSDGVLVQGHPNIGDVLKRFAEKALTFKGNDGLGNISEVRVEGFDGWLSAFKDRVHLADVSELRVNVFDRVREAAEAMGITFEDITGRSYEFRETSDGQVRAYMREQPTTADAVARYNRGQTDILGLNSGSATGVSAQASIAHGRDVRRREMIKLAFQREITDERQVEGRVHRAGQIVPPRYTIPVTGFAPDDRIANLFNRANRSLTASTSATRENRTNADHAVDILNPIGERAATQVLLRNPSVAEMLGIDPLKSMDVARKLLGRSVMLPLAEQSAILSEVDATFRVIADKMTTEGTNPLRLQFYDWKAGVETVEDLIPGDPGAQGIASQPLRLNQVIYREEVESLPARTVLGNVLEAARRREEPFENMHKAWDYPTLFERGALVWEHHLMGSVTGRRSEGMRHLWPLPMPGVAATWAMELLRRELSAVEGRTNRSLNNDEFREASELLGARLSNPKEHVGAFDAYRKQVWDKLGPDALREGAVALALRAMWNRSEQVSRLNKFLPLIEPGQLVALDSRALTSVAAGNWGQAYERVDLKTGLIPALITSARYEADAPFAESKMSFSVFVPGARFTERLTISALHTAMDLSTSEDVPPVRPLSSFLAAMEKRPPGNSGSAFQQATRAALEGLMTAEGLTALQDRIVSLQQRHGLDSLAKVVAGGVEVTPAGHATFSALTEAMPQDAIVRRRITLEGNLFAAMSAVSSSVANATTGEKVVYTDRHGTQRNAILLSNRSTDKLVENVRRKVAKRSLVHSGLSDAEAVADYLRLTNAVQFGVGYWDRTGESEVLDALGRFYPNEFGGERREQVADNFAEVMASIRGRMRSMESTFPASVMAGGDVWRWGTDIAQKAAMQTENPRGYVAGVGGPVSATVRTSPEVNVLGFRDVSVSMSVQPYALAAAVSAVERTNALAMNLSQGSVTLALHKDHSAFKDPATSGLLDRLQQQVMDTKLRAGVLAGNFELQNPEHRALVARVVTETGGGKLELLVGGVMKEIQHGLGEEAANRKRAHYRAGLAAEAAAERPAPFSRPVVETNIVPSSAGGMYGP